MIIWNFNKWMDNFLIKHSEEEVRAFFNSQVSRREMLLRLVKAKEEYNEAGKK